MEPQAVFDAMDDNKALVFALAGIAMLGNYIWFFGAIKASRKDGVYAIPLFLTFFWFAHDSSFVLRYDEWFNTYDHWFPQLFWVLLIFTVAFELYYMSQTITVGHRELAPQLTTLQYRVGFLLALTGMYIAWIWLKQSMDDPIYLDIFALTVLSYPCLAISMMLRRRSRRGFNGIMCWGFTQMAVFYFIVSTFFFGDYFQRWEYYLVGIASVTLALAMVWVYRTLPEYTPTDEAAASDDAEPVRQLA